MKQLSVRDFLDDKLESPILDVRSPREYAVGHIPGAISFPIFENEERAEIGTLYKQKGKQIAVKRGLEIVGPKLIQYVEQAEHLKSKPLRVHCWRGGMRSESMATLLEKCGFDVSLLTGGYKSYRRDLHAFFQQKLPLKVVTGFTGSQKTELLNLLKKEGQQVVDLEGLAEHQGSSFGNKKSVQQPATEHFQNLVYEDFRKLDLSKTIWIEDESMRIGQVSLPEDLYLQKNKSPHVYMEIDKSERVEFLQRDYACLEPSQAIAATNSITPKLGAENAKRAIECINAGDIKEAVEILLTYYDRQYEKARIRKADLISEHHKISMSQLHQLAKELSSKE